MFTSDGTILAKGFVLLEDDKALQPSENIAPAVRSEIIDAYGDDFANALNAVSAKLTTAELISLNYLVGFEGQDPEAVAAEWLKAIGVVSE
jgi:osmoprotectant transport system substrate-binding protein